jgi:flap endonuclease-1
MGVKRLSAYLHKQAPHVYRPVLDPRAFQGQHLVVDVSIYMHKFAYLKDAADTCGAFLDKFLAQHAALMAEGAGRVTYVFDGASPVVKRAELQRRAAARVEVEARAAAAEPGSAEGAQLQRRVAAVQVKAWHYATLKAKLAAMDVPFVQAVGEAEKCMAWMCVTGAADVAVTEDIDAVVCGAPVVLRGVHMSLCGDKVHEVRLADVLGALELTYEQLVDFSILCGCDFSATLPGIGPVKALDMLRRHGSIEQVLAAEMKGYQVPAGFLFVEARAAFTSAETQLRVDDEEEGAAGAE